MVLWDTPPGSNPSHSPWMASASCLALMTERSRSGMPRLAPLFLVPLKGTPARSAPSHSLQMASVSGSKDRTVRVWNAETDAIISGPFEGHTGLVSPVGFSSDGKHHAF